MITWLMRFFFSFHVEINGELYQASKCYSFPLSCPDLHHAELLNSPCAALLESVKGCSFSQEALVPPLHFTGITAVTRTHAFSGAFVDNENSGLFTCRFPAVTVSLSARDYP